MKKQIVSLLASGAFVSAGVLGMFAPVSALAQQYAFSNNLAVGSTGSDVVSLQTWLISNGFNIPAISSGGLSKGYFGSQTQAAVMAYQRSISIPTTGFFGPLTRQYINGNGGNNNNGNNGNNNNGGNNGNNGSNNGGYYWGWNQNDGFGSTVLNLNGPSTLTVNQTGTWSVSASGIQNGQYGNLTYSVTWGDEYNYGAYTSNGNVTAPALYNQNTTFTHSYSNVGTYTITFTVRSNLGYTASKIMTVVVGTSNNASPLTITSPNGGELWQRGTVQSILWTAPQFFVATYVDITLVPYMTPCAPGMMCAQYIRAPYTIARNISIDQHSYAWRVGDYTDSGLSAPADGQYTIRICQVNTSVCDSSNVPFNISTNGGTTYGGQQPVISGITSPVTIRLNQSATWTINAYDPQNNGSPLSYSVTWGDEYTYGTYPAMTTSSGQQVFTQGTTFTHTYNHTGVFTVTFTVRNSSGQSTVTTSTVNVTY